jgi:hypothetical protein
MAKEGGEVVVFNTQERALSTDVQRSQSFRVRDMAEVVRNLINVFQGLDDVDAGSLYEPTTTTTSPLTAEVLSGLLVQPQNATLNLLITAGLAYVITPQATPDNSIYEFVNDPGVATLGALVMTGNSSGSTRIDVIECQPTDQVLEADSRDIFNPTTGLFTASTVTKATAAQMTYRVRLGIAGSGYPGSASGWLPLAVASVPTATTTNDTITFWDVRPLLSDRRGISNVGLQRPQAEKVIINGLPPTTTGGYVEALQSLALGYPARRLGGQLHRGSPGTDATTIDLTSSANQESSFSISNGFPWYLYLLTPQSLPRWARYSDAVAGARQPRSPRGIPLLSRVAPTLSGAPSSAITFPAVFGFTSGNNTTSSGACVAAGTFTSGAVVAPVANAGEQLAVYGTVTGVQSGTSPVISAFTFVANTHYPSNATAILVEFTIDITITAAIQDQVSYTVVVYNPPGSSTIAYTFLVGSAYPTITSPPLTANVRVHLWLPLPSVAPSDSAPATQNINFNISGTSLSTAGGFAFANVVGFRF